MCVGSVLHAGIVLQKKKCLLENLFEGWVTVCVWLRLFGLCHLRQEKKTWLGWKNIPPTPLQNKWSVTTVSHVLDIILLLFPFNLLSVSCVGRRGWFDYFCWSRFVHFISDWSVMLRPKIILMLPCKFQSSCLGFTRVWILQLGIYLSKFYKSALFSFCWSFLVGWFWLIYGV